jgi:probable F420-dependent oxidoreductase
VRIGLALPHYDFSIPGVSPITFEALAEVAVRAERLGFDSVWVSDHFYSTMERYGGGPEPYGTLDPLVTLAALAPLTERVRLGTLVLSAGFRHPAIVGKSATAIDRFSDGRLELGMGAGWFEAEYDGFGYEFGTAGDRMELLEESVGYLDALFGDEPATFEGPHFALRDAYNRPRPVQEPRPPLIVGGKGGPRLLRIAARHGDGWNTVWRWTPEDYAPKAAAAREACERAGRDPAGFRLSLGLFTVVGEDDADVSRRYELMRERLPDRAVDSTELDELRVDGLVGTPEQVLERIGAFASLGVSELIIGAAPVWFALPDPSMLDVLAEAVLPAAREL